MRTKLSTILEEPVQEFASVYIPFIYDHQIEWKGFGEPSNGFVFEHLRQSLHYCRRNRLSNYTDEYGINYGIDNNGNYFIECSYVQSNKRN